MRAPPASHPHAEDPLPLLHSTGLPARWRSALPRGGGRPWGARAPFFGGGECLSQRLGLRRAPSGRTPAASVPPSPVSASLYRASTRALTLLYLLPFRVSPVVALASSLAPASARYWAPAARVRGPPDAISCGSGARRVGDGARRRHGREAGVRAHAGALRATRLCAQAGCVRASAPVCVRAPLAVRYLMRL